MRALVVSNMQPDAGAPHRGSFVRDQVAALRDLAGPEVDLLELAPGLSGYPGAVRAIRRRLREGGHDLVHAHFGLTGVCAALAGARPLVVTFHGTDLHHPLSGRLSRALTPRIDLAAFASRRLAAAPFAPTRRRAPGAVAALPCGVDTGRFTPTARRDARLRAGLDPDGRYLLFSADPARPEKRHDLALEVARRAGATLLSAGATRPDRMPDLVNAASAVIAPSDREGFGLAPLEALACDVPALATPVGIAPLALGRLDGCLVGEFDAARWGELAGRHLDATDPRVDGRARALTLSAGRMAERVAVAWEEVLAAWRAR